MTDADGNILYRQNNAIKLHLKSEPHPRKLGKIDEVNKTFIVERDSTKHLFNKINGYGFNFEVLNCATVFDKVLLKLTDKKETYSIPISEILTKGQFLNFKQQGFELQIFLPLNIIQQWQTHT